MPTGQEARRQLKRGGGTESSWQSPMYIRHKAGCGTFTPHTAMLTQAVISSHHLFSPLPRILLELGWYGFRLCCHSLSWLLHAWCVVTFSSALEPQPFQHATCHLMRRSCALVAAAVGGSRSVGGRKKSPAFHCEWFTVKHNLLRKWA